MDKIYIMMRHDLYDDMGEIPKSSIFAVYASEEEAISECESWGNSYKKYEKQSKKCNSCLVRSELRAVPEEDIHEFIVKTNKKRRCANLYDIKIDGMLTAVCSNDLSECYGQTTTFHVEEIKLPKQ